jgi:hypothetical protein
LSQRSARAEGERGDGRVGKFEVRSNLPVGKPLYLVEEKGSPLTLWKEVKH